MISGRNTAAGPCRASKSSFARAIEVSRRPAPLER